MNDYFWLKAFKFNNGDYEAITIECRVDYPREGGDPVVVRRTLTRTPEGVLVESWRGEELLFRADPRPDLPVGPQWAEIVVNEAPDVAPRQLPPLPYLLRWWEEGVCTITELGGPGSGMGHPVEVDRFDLPGGLGSLPIDHGRVLRDQWLILERGPEEVLVTPLPYAPYGWIADEESNWVRMREL